MWASTLKKGNTEQFLKKLENKRMNGKADPKRNAFLLLAMADIGVKYMTVDPSQIQTQPISFALLVNRYDHFRGFL